LERRRSGTGAREALAAAVAALLIRQQEAAQLTCDKATVLARPSSSWKASWRPRDGRWGGMIDGAGGQR